MEIAYILQITTIFITLFLGMISYFQTKKIQHGQNIISVTTKYRSERSEQLKEAGISLLANTSSQLLQITENAFDMLKEATLASEKISMILHRNFAADQELISLADEIVKAATAYTNNHSTDYLNKLLYLQETFRLKCDLYSAADWNRIKQETKGENTSSRSWIDYHDKLEADFKKSFDNIKIKYNQADK